MKLVRQGFERLLTAGQVAAHCQVATRTVERWIHAGQLHSFSLPSGHFRIPEQSLREFLADGKFPLQSPVIDLERLQVLILDTDTRRGEELLVALTTIYENLRVKRFVSGPSTLMQVGRSRPDVLFLEFSRQFEPIVPILKMIHEQKALSHLRVVALRDRGETVLPSVMKYCAGQLAIPTDEGTLQELMDRILS